MSDEGTKRGYRFFEWINRRVFPLSVGIVAVAVALGVIGPLVASDDEPSFEPGGQIYDTQERVDEAFSSDSPIVGATFVVETPDAGPDPNAFDHDVLTAAALREFTANSDAVRAAYRVGGSGDDAPLVTVFDNDLGVEIDGIFSIADAVDAAIPGGLEAASDADVKFALQGILADSADTANLRFTLSRLATRSLERIGNLDVVVWRSPAFFAHVRYDIDTFPDDMEIEGFEGRANLDAERWLRTVQSDLRGDQAEIAVLGIVIDGGLVNEEQGAAAAPFIFLAVAFILLFVGALLRSYWAAMLTAAGLGAVMMSYNGINSLIGLKVASPLIVFVVPIALISFGVDFFIHGSGRAREMQVEGVSRERAYPLGATLLFTALLLAAGSSVGAFLSNAASGIQAITEFGIAAAVAIALSYVVLGLVAPRQLLAIEEALGPRPEDRGLSIVRRVAFPIACVLAGVVVTLTIVMPAMGAPLYLVVLLGVLLWLPFLLTRRRNRRAAAAGVPLTEEVKGAGHGFAAAGSVVHFLARWRVFTLPVVAALAVAGVWAFFQVDSAFEIKDFFSSRTDMVKSLDKVETHLGSSASAPAYVYVEGDLTDPAALRALEAAAAHMDEADAAGRVELARDYNGDLVVTPNAAELVRITAGLPDAVAAVEAASGVTIADGDGDGLPDDPAAIGAIYSYIAANGIPGPGFTAVRADQVERSLWTDGTVQGTRVEVVVPSFSDDRNVLDTRAELEVAADGLEDALGDDASFVSVSGSAITSQDGLASFTDAMLISLPIAIVVTALLALLVMRSLRYALISMVPILLVVAWLYGFMYLADYKINVITAMIAAIAIGVGIDYATHFTVRFRQEFHGEPSRFPALRRAGVGTGGALAVSALTSVTGFLVMAAAPMPMFATFGVLTAVMIFLALAVSLLVLPSLLLLVTPSRKGDERAEMEEAITGGEFEYRPHDPDTADLRHPHRDGGEE